MGFFDFLCPSNKLLDTLRDAFNATPLTTPDNSVQPLDVIARQAGKTHYLGPLKNLYEYPTGLNIKPEENEVAEKEIRSTGTIHFSMGLKLLANLFKGFGMKSDTLASNLCSVEKISISFNDIKRRRVSPTKLGKALRGKRLDKNNPSAKPFIRKERDMLIITSVLVANGFDLIIEKTEADDFKVDLLKLTEEADNDLINIKEDKNNRQKISFSGKEYLTFAFSCIEAKIDTDGSMSFGDTINPEIPETRGLAEEGEIAEFSLVPQGYMSLYWDDLEEEENDIK